MTPTEMAQAQKTPGESRKVWEQSVAHRHPLAQLAAIIRPLKIDGTHPIHLEMQDGLTVMVRLSQEDALWLAQELTKNTSDVAQAAATQSDKSSGIPK